MKQVVRSVTAIAGLLLALTWLAMRAATPDTERHERILGALQTLILSELNSAPRCLRARDGLLNNYDPLVHSLKELRESGSTIQRLNDDVDTKHSVRDLRAALDEQASLVDIQVPQCAAAKFAALLRLRHPAAGHRRLR